MNPMAHRVACSTFFNTWLTASKSVGNNRVLPFLLEA
jgi:hypothetical protein